MKNTTQDLTVLVIGAGANADFRFKDEKKAEKEKIAMPTGEQLVAKVADWEGQVLPNLYWGFIAKIVRKHHDDESQVGQIANNFASTQNDYDNIVSFVDNIAKNIADTTQKGFNSGWFSELGVTYSIVRSRIDDGISKKLEEDDEFSWYHKISGIVKHYQPFSIDEILDSIKIGKIDISKWSDSSEDSKTKLIKAGKDLIALFLLQSENKRVFDYDSICWYRHLRNAIITCGKNKNEIEEKLKNFVIISFNYDRSLDYFLRTRVGEFYDKIKVIYPYGSLAEKEIWKSVNYEKIGYGAAKNQTSFETKWKNFEKAKILAQDLNVIGELEENKKGIGGITEIKNVMAGSKKLYFLGFAFHQENCRIMGMLEGQFKQYSIAMRRQFREGIFYTNFKNSQKLKISFDAIFNVHMDGAIVTNIGHSSEKGVYDALAQDFDFNL